MSTAPKHQATPPQPNTPLPALLGGLKTKHVATEAAFEQLNKAVGDFLLGEPTDPEALHALVDRCECAYVDVATDADDAIRTLLHVHAPLPFAGIEEPSDLEAMDQAVDRLASTEAQALAAFGVLDATVRQWGASVQAGDAPARIAGFVADVLQALALARQHFGTYQDAADDVVVTAGAAIGELLPSPAETEAAFAAHFADNFLVVGADNLLQAGMVDHQNGLIHRLRSQLEALHRALRNAPDSTVELAFDIDQAIVDLITLMGGELAFRRPPELAGRAMSALAVLALIEPGCNAGTLPAAPAHTTATTSAASAATVV